LSVGCPIPPGRIPGDGPRDQASVSQACRELSQEVGIGVWAASPAPNNPDKLRTRKDSPHRAPALGPGRPAVGIPHGRPGGSRRHSGRTSVLFTQRGESMNSLLLVVLVSCPPVAAYPDAEPVYGGSASHQGRHRLFGWLWGHHHDNKCPCAGNGHARGSWPPVIAAPALGIEAGTVEAVTLEPAPTVIPAPPC